MKLTVQTEEMNWPSIRKAIDSGFKTILIPVGSIEQHGPHLPTFTDALLAHELCGRLAAKLGRTLVAPVIRPGCSEHHLAFSGTVSVSPSMLVKLVDAYIGSLKKAGFTNFVIIPTHGGNFEPLRKGFATLKKKYRKVNLYGYFDLQRFVGAMNEAAAQFGISPEASGAHSGFAETSCVLAVRPDLVDMASAAPGYVGPFDKNESRQIHKKGMTAFTKNGVLGDPTRSSAEAGEKIIQNTVDCIASVLNEIGLKT
jgi:creatinine amidohydrolase